MKTVENALCKIFLIEPRIRTVEVWDKQTWGSLYPRPYSFPWVTLIEYKHNNQMQVYFHNEPWLTEQDGYGWLDIYAAPTYFCHVLKNGYICYHHGLRFPEHLLTVSPVERFFFTGFNDWTSLQEIYGYRALMSQSPWELENLFVMKDIKNPKRVLSLNWRRSLTGTNPNL